jgi:hypothetical protein
MDGQTEGQTDGRTNGQTNILMFGLTNVRSDKRQGRTKVEVGQMSLFSLWSDKRQVGQMLKSDKCPVFV